MSEETEKKINEVILSKINAAEDVDVQLVLAWAVLQAIPILTDLANSSRSLADSLKTVDIYANQLMRAKNYADNLKADEEYRRKR
jgi:hypothetical protein